jgi:tryptophan synthase alpha chain
MSNSLNSVFEKCASEKRSALIGYVTAGFPTLEKSKEIAKAMADGGVDIIEIGFPYSDPVMDGPIIQEASQTALENKTGAKEVLELTKSVASLGIPALVMSYWNPIEKYGTKKFAADLAGIGSSGTITPDLTIEEAEPWLSESRTNNLANVFVVAPSTTDTRIAAVTSKGSGFVYAASLMGVTGTRNSISSDAKSLVDRVRKQSKLPVCVGLGVSNPEQAKEVASYADGVIVGSAFTKRVMDASNFESGVIAVKELASALREAMVK